MSAIPTAAVVPVARLVANAIDGNVPDAIDAARALLALGLELVPVEDLRAYLDDAARERGDRAFEALKDLKFGGEP